jgi:hypothetical protein
MNNGKYLSIKVKYLIYLTQFMGKSSASIAAKLPITYDDDATILLTDPKDIAWVKEGMKKMEDMQKAKEAEMSNSNNGVYHR